MSARITKAEVAFLLPSPRSQVAEQVEALRLAAARAHQAALVSGLRQGVARLADAVLGWPARLAAQAELRAMSDRELADMGLNRSDIARAVTGR